jgi:hypothetical protein
LVAFNFCESYTSSHMHILFIKLEFKAYGNT